MPPADLPAPADDGAARASRGGAGRVRGTRRAYEYAVLRVVPSVERGEFLNAGVLLYAQAEDFLAARVHLAPDRLRALAPGADVDAVVRQLDGIRDLAAGDGGPGSALPRGERFRWLVAPRSTVLRAGPVHMGLAEDPATELERLLGLLVH